MAKKNESVLVGKNTGRIVEQKEEIIKFPSLNSIWYLVSEYSDRLGEFFISADHFIYYLKDLVENKNYNLAVDGVICIIFQEICDYAWEENTEYVLADEMDEIKFTEILKSNFKYLYEQYKKNK